MIFVHDIVRVSSAATRYLAAKKQKIDIDKSIGNMNPNESVEESNRCFSREAILLPKTDGITTFQRT